MDENQGDIAGLRHAIEGAARVVFLTGAGISTESGIPDFRSPTGLYAGGINTDVFEIDVFRERPEVFYGFARTFLDTVRKARPNAGHLAMAALAGDPGRRVDVVTQNIDTLHQDAGSPVVWPVHGSMATSRCERCDTRVPTHTLWPCIEVGEVPRHQACGGVFRPDIVFFGEPLPESVFAAAEHAVSRADLLIIAGTSLAVYPAAGLPQVRRRACKVAIINRSVTPLDGEAHFVFRDSIGAVLAEAVGTGSLSIGQPESESGNEKPPALRPGVP